jgi:hypothetical protein
MKASPNAIGAVCSLLLAASGCSSGAPTNNVGTVVPSSVATVRESSSSSCQPDFSLQLSSTSVSITAGQTVDVGFGMTSLCGLAGTINVGKRISPTPTITCKKVKGQDVCTSNGPIVQQCCYDFQLKAGSSIGNHFAISATDSTVKTTYTITVRAQDISGGCCYGLSHSASFTLTVT